MIILRILLGRILLGVFAVPWLAWSAGAVEAHYEAYAAGFEVIDMEASWDVRPDVYAVTMDVRSVGAFDLLLRTSLRTVVSGRFVAGRPVPIRFVSSGAMRGENRVTEIDYAGGNPMVKRLMPPNAGEREDVPLAQQAGTVDTLSAMALLMRRVNTTGRCDGTLTTFDGRRLAVLEARTSGEQELPPSGRSNFAGKALRCEFEGRQTGGFALGDDDAWLRRPQKGTAWFASTTPGGPKIPVRVSFQTKWFGDATMYVAAKD